MRCPFCLNPIVDPNPGEKICPKCQAEFEIDERGECVFANQENMRVTSLVLNNFGLAPTIKTGNPLFFKFIVRLGLN